MKPGSGHIPRVEWRRAGLAAGPDCTQGPVLSTEACFLPAKISQGRPGLIPTASRVFRSFVLFSDGQSGGKRALCKCLTGTVFLKCISMKMI